MKKYSNSLYAVNKFSKNIVYPFVDKTRNEITLEDLRVDDPCLTEEDFEKWKKWSDENYHGEDLGNYNGTYRNVSLDEAYNVADRTELSVEEQYIEKEEQECAAKTLLQLREGRILTEMQYRRFHKHIENGMSLREIATIEGVCCNAIEQSIHSSKKRIKKISNFFE